MISPGMWCAIRFCVLDPEPEIFFSPKMLPRELNHLESVLVQNVLPKTFEILQRPPHRRREGRDQADAPYSGDQKHSNDGWPQRLVLFLLFLFFFFLYVGDKQRDCPTQHAQSCTVAQRFSTVSEIC